MEAVLVLSSLVLISIAWIWLVISSVPLSIALVLTALVCPIATLFMRGRGYAVWPRWVLTLGLVAGLTGLGLLYQDQPERVELLLSGQWMESQRQSGAIQGAVMGQEFTPDRVLWRGNELVFEEGPENSIRRSLGIHFHTAPELLDNVSVDRLPGDQGAWPEVVLQWHNGALTPPGLQRIADSYSLSLTFTPVTNGKVDLKIHLHLPSAQATWLSGEAQLLSTPPWLEQVQAKQRAAVTQKEAAPPEAGLGGVSEPVPPRWHPVSLLALLDEPELFSGSRLRLTTVTGRVHEGRLKGVTDDRRIVLAQAYGSNQVDLQFHPQDLSGIETFSVP